jgi:hypothetical protein
MNEEAQLEVLNIITTEYKNKSFIELSKLGEGGIGFHYQDKELLFWIEINTNKKLQDILRIMICVEPDCLTGNMKGRARYFGVTSDNKIIENNNMAF